MAELLLLVFLLLSAFLRCLRSLLWELSLVASLLLASPNVPVGCVVGYLPFFCWSTVPAVASLRYPLLIVFAVTVTLPLACVNDFS